MEDDAIYVDSSFELSGLAALVSHIGAVASREPGSHIVLTSGVDQHRALLRFS